MQSAYQLCEAAPAASASKTQGFVPYLFSFNCKLNIFHFDNVDNLFVNSKNTRSINNKHDN